MSVQGFRYYYGNLYSTDIFNVCFRMIPLEGYLPRAHAYADDTQLYVSFKADSSSAQSDAVNAMECYITAIRSWMIKDKLRLNDTKTELMIIGTRQQLAKVNNDGL